MSPRCPTCLSVSRRLLVWGGEGERGEGGLASGKRSRVFGAQFEAEAWAWVCARVFGCAEIPDMDQFLEELYVLVNRYACAAQLFWGHWAIIQAKHSPIDFDFLTYAKLRLDGYYFLKARFCNTAGPEVGPSP
jgi:hypothetical protein